MNKIFWLILPILAIIIALGGCYYYQSVPQEDNGENGDNETCGTCGVETNDCGATKFGDPNFPIDSPKHGEPCEEDADCEFHPPADNQYAVYCCENDGTCYET